MEIRDVQIAGIASARKAQATGMGKDWARTCYSTHSSGSSLLRRMQVDA